MQLFFIFFFFVLSVQSIGNGVYIVLQQQIAHHMDYKSCTSRIGLYTYEDELVVPPFCECVSPLIALGSSSADFRNRKGVAFNKEDGVYLQVRNIQHVDSIAYGYSVFYLPPSSKNFKTVSADVISVSYGRCFYLAHYFLSLSSSTVV